MLRTRVILVCWALLSVCRGETQGRAAWAARVVRGGDGGQNRYGITGAGYGRAQSPFASPAADGAAASRPAQDKVSIAEHLIATENAQALDTSSMIGDFQHRRGRMAFIRKVYSILSVQMLATVGVVAYMSANKFSIITSSVFREFGSRIYMGASILSLGLAFFLGSSDVRFKAPQNYMLLGLFTLLQSGIMGTLGMLYKPRSVALVGLQTAVAFLGLTAYSFQANPKYDLTGMGQTLSGWLLAAFFGSIMNAFFFRAPLFELGISLACTGLFLAFVVRDTQAMIGGRHHQQSFDSREHIRAAMAIYLDVANLFLSLLRILGDPEGSS